MATRLRVPRSPEERRALKAARQKRWRDNARAKQQVAAVVDHAAGVASAPDAVLPKNLSKSDLATLMRDRIVAIVAEMPDDALLNKDFAPTLNLGLKAQAQLDSREKAKSKKGTAELAFAIIAMLNGAPPPAQLEDGRTIEGTAVEVDEDGELQEA